MSNERMREFVYTVSHDLQEPLRSISSFADLLKKRYANSLDGQGVEFLEYVHAGAGRMSGLIRDLLAYSRVLHDDPDLFEAVSLKRAVEIVCETLKESIESNRATVTCGELPTVRANPNRMLQLFQNLISNAVKYRSARAPAIQVSAYRDEDRWVMSVSDNGIGIDRADQERIFGLVQASARAPLHRDRGSGWRSAMRLSRGTADGYGWKTLLAAVRSFASLSARISRLSC